MSGSAEGVRGSGAGEGEWQRHESDVRGVLGAPQGIAQVMLRHVPGPARTPLVCISGFLALIIP